MDLWGKRCHNAKRDNERQAHDTTNSNKFDVKRPTGKKNKDIDANGPTIYSAASASASSFESEGLSAVKAYIYKHNAKKFF